MNKSIGKIGNGRRDVALEMYLKPLIDEVLNGRKTLEELEKEIINNVKNVPRGELLVLIHGILPEYCDCINEKAIVCKCCGNCCDFTKELRRGANIKTGIAFDVPDIIRISRYRNMNPERFIRKYLSRVSVSIDDSIPEGMGAFKYVLKKRYIKPCIFRKKNNKCKIYPVRPINCQQYPLRSKVLYLDPLCEGYKETLHLFLNLIYSLLTDEKKPIWENGSD